MTGGCRLGLQSRTTWESPHKLFSSTDPVAVLIARLCILREDAYLELAGLSAASVEATFNTDSANPPGLEDNGKFYRQMYFLRASIRTLAEIQETIKGLESLEAFRNLLDKNPESQASVRGYQKRLNRNLEDLRRLRNNLGGHVSKEGVQEALDNPQHLDETGKLDVGGTHRDTHYGFTIPLCAQMLFLKVSDEEKQTFFENICSLHDGTLSAIDMILVEYLDSQGYFK